MGGDIAAWCALRGLSVTLQDREMKYIEPALARAAKLFDRRLATAEARAGARARLQADVAGDGIATADVLIEAIFENLEAKRILFQAAEARARPGCVLATNTSSIPLEDIAVALRQPERLVGLHFFNPVAKLPLVEVIRGPASSETVVQEALGFARQIGKLPVPCASRPGFLVNRTLAPYMAEAMALAQEGVPLAEIDAAATDFGMPMGPVELADSVGLDIVLHVARILAPVLGRAAAPEVEQLVAQGHLGQKTGRGFYLYQDGKPVKPRGSGLPVDPEVQDRLILAFLNEAAQCLHEGIVADADLADAGIIFGTGFAPFRGGPLRYAEHEGLDQLVAVLDRFAQHQPRLAPSPALRRFAELGQGFFVPIAEPDVTGRTRCANGTVGE
jgi:3-hydroxyacyl-CoA dehydrogenase/enoyl-CoA hydratase/3-hydroxybutyryl-CoA epimerase